MKPLKALPHVVPEALLASTDQLAKNQDAGQPLADANLPLCVEAHLRSALPGTREGHPAADVTALTFSLQAYRSKMGGNAMSFSAVAAQAVPYVGHLLQLSAPQGLDLQGVVKRTQAAPVQKLAEIISKDLRSARFYTALFYGVAIASKGSSMLGSTFWTLAGASVGFLAYHASAQQQLEFFLLHLAGVASFYGPSLNVLQLATLPILLSIVAYHFGEDVRAKPQQNFFEKQMPASTQMIVVSKKPLVLQPKLPVPFWLLPSLTLHEMQLNSTKNSSLQVELGFFGLKFDVQWPPRHLEALITQRTWAQILSPLPKMAQSVSVASDGTLSWSLNNVALKVLPNGRAAVLTMEDGNGQKFLQADHAAYLPCAVSGLDAARGDIPFHFYPHLQSLKSDAGSLAKFEVGAFYDVDLKNQPHFVKQLTETLHGIPKILLPKNDGDNIAMGNAILCAGAVVDVQRGLKFVVEAAEVDGRDDGDDSLHHDDAEGLVIHPPQA